jgi:hypothetical protein
LTNIIDFLAYPLPIEIKTAIIEGDYSKAKKIITNYMTLNIPQEMILRLKYELERMAQIKKNYSYNEREALAILRKKLKDYRLGEFQDWLENGYIDRIRHNNRYLYFSRFFDNLLFLNPALSDRRKVSTRRVELAKTLLNERIEKINRGELLKYRITAGIKINLKKSERYKVWLPIPLENGMIENVKILKTEPEHNNILKKSVQNTIYFEAENNNFSVEFQYDIKEISLKSQNVLDDLEKGFKISEMLKEKYPHVIFSPYLKKLTESIVSDEKNTYQKAKKIYDWITENVRYTYVPDYFLFDNISEYVATSLRGDCGMQALLFITMCRIAGLPAKWQSGWYITPYNASPHDWAQIYIEPYGWIPVDPSKGGINNTKNFHKRDFYFGNLDGFRMIANEDFQVDFDPSKKYMRSDPVDNQIGEVETDSQNIFPDKFKHKIYIRKFERLH